MNKGLLKSNATASVSSVTATSSTIPREARVSQETITGEGAPSPVLLFASYDRRDASGKPYAIRPIRMDDLVAMMLHKYRTGVEMIPFTVHRLLDERVLYGIDHRLCKEDWVPIPGRFSTVDINGNQLQVSCRAVRTTRQVVYSDKEGPEVIVRSVSAHIGFIHCGCNGRCRHGDHPYTRYEDYKWSHELQYHVRVSCWLFNTAPMSKELIGQLLQIAGVELNPGPVCRFCGQHVSGDLTAHLKEKHSDLHHPRKQGTESAPPRKGETGTRDGRSANLIGESLKREDQKLQGEVDAARELQQEAKEQIKMAEEVANSHVITANEHKAIIKNLKSKEKVYGDCGRVEDEDVIVPERIRGEVGDVWTIVQLTEEEAKESLWYDFKTMFKETAAMKFQAAVDTFSRETEKTIEAIKQIADDIEENIALAGLEIMLTNLRYENDVEEVFTSCAQSCVDEGRADKMKPFCIHPGRAEGQTLMECPECMSDEADRRITACGVHFGKCLRDVTQKTFLHVTTVVNIATDRVEKIMPDIARLPPLCVRIVPPFARMCIEVLGIPLETALEVKIHDYWWRSQNVQTATLKAVILQVVEKEDDDRSLSSRHYVGLQKTTIASVRFFVKIRHNTMGMMFGLDPNSKSHIYTAAPYIRDSLVAIGASGRWFKTLPVNVNVLMNMNESNLLYNDKEHADFKRMAVNNVHGQKAIAPALFRRLKEKGNDDVAAAIDIVNDLRVGGHNTGSLVNHNAPATLK